MSFRVSFRVSTLLFSSFLLAAVVIGLTCCSTARRYTSLDLGLLPCEEGDAPIFFRAVEFDRHGGFQYPDQQAELLRRLSDAPPITDLIVFVHGWNKNPSSAELDYQNFLCRLHARLRQRIPDVKRRGGLAVVGVFWPSTITNRPQEPLLAKPLSYFRIRRRADNVADVGLASFIRSLTEPMARARSTATPVRLHLIGHSFGGRMIVKSLEELHSKARLMPILDAAEETNVVLINAAVSPSRFNWLSEALRSAKAQGAPSPFPGGPAAYLFNVHSTNDRANRFLFPVASLFSDDDAVCAVGACGVTGYPSVCVSPAGGLEIAGLEAAPLAPTLNAWNVNATRIVFDHSDIYKGRVATLIADLLYDDAGKKRLPRSSNNVTCR